MGSRGPLTVGACSRGGYLLIGFFEKKSSLTDLYFGSSAKLAGRPPTLYAIGPLVPIPHHILEHGIIVGYPCCEAKPMGNNYNLRVFMLKNLYFFSFFVDVISLLDNTLADLGPYPPPPSSTNPAFPPNTTLGVSDILFGYF
jgi:hypothetical protein